MATGMVESAEHDSEEEEQQGGQRTPMVQRLLDAPNLPAFVRDLITTQATTVVGTEAVGFLIEDGGDGEKSLRLLAHVRPDNSAKDVRDAAIKAFIELVKPCIKEGKDGAIAIGNGDAYQPESQYCLVTILRAEGQAVAVSAVITRCMNDERARQRLTSMQLVAGYFELFTLRHNVEQSRLIAHSHQHVLQLAAAVATAEGYSSAAMNLCNELANRSGATRVSLGWYKGRNIKIKALSHTEEFDKKQELITTIERVMEECADQEEIVQFNPTTGKNSENVTREAQALSRAQGGNIVLSIPLRRQAEVEGVLTLEFLPTANLGPQLSHGLAVAVDLLAPQLYDRYQNDRWLITKAGLSAKTLAEHTFRSKQYVLGKLIAILVVALLAFVTFFAPMYHVNASFVFSAPNKTVISAPFESVIRTIGTTRNGEPLRPGDRVKKGDLLFTLESSELQDRLIAAQQEYDSNILQAMSYRGEKKRAEANIAEAKANEARANVDLYSYQIAQSSVSAPYDGVILKGDLSARRGQKAQLGEELFEITPDNTLRIELTVPERDVQDVKIGATGHLATNALPWDKFAFTVDRIIPVPQAKEGSNSFMVYAHVDPSEVAARQPLWRPGMEGEGRVDVGHHRLVWIWTHRLIDFLRLKLWM